MGRYVVGITGASGGAYARATLRGLLAAGHEVVCVVSDAGRRVIDLELGLRLSGAAEADEERLRGSLGLPDATGLRLIDHRDVGAAIASGSYQVNGMAIVPCSTGTLGRIANGVSSSLIERAADVALKERRRLVLVPRETPLSLVHLRNMVAVTEAGAIVLPASPGLYHRPESIDDLVDSIAGRVLAHLGVDTPLLKSWEGGAPQAFAGLEEL